jgi:cytochrome b561
MDWKSTHRGYGWAAIGLHWLMLVLIVAVYCTMEFKSVYPRGSASRAALANWHYLLGLSVFVLVWVRLLVRLCGEEPAIVPPLPQWQATTSRMLHWALYALMIALPVLGWLTVSARGVPVTLFGAEGLQIMPLIDPNPDLAKLFKQVHEALANAGYFLVAVHSAAALYHHHFKRDNTLTRMLAGR